MKQYLDMCQYILENGQDRDDRTGTGTRISPFFKASITSS